MSTFSQTDRLVSLMWVKYEIYNEHVIDIMTKRFEQRVRNKLFLCISMCAFSQTDKLVRVTWGKQPLL
jgi:hypothetical protein